MCSEDWSEWVTPEQLELARFLERDDFRKRHLIEAAGPVDRDTVNRLTAAAGFPSTGKPGRQGTPLTGSQVILGALLVGLYERHCPMKAMQGLYSRLMFNWFERTDRSPGIHPDPPRSDLDDAPPGTFCTPLGYCKMTSGEQTASGQLLLYCPILELWGGELVRSPDSRRVLLQLRMKGTDDRSWHVGIDHGYDPREWPTVVVFDVWSLLIPICERLGIPAPRDLHNYTIHNTLSLAPANWEEEIHTRMLQASARESSLIAKLRGIPPAVNKITLQRNREGGITRIQFTHRNLARSKAKRYAKSPQTKEVREITRPGQQPHYAVDVEYQL